MKQLATNYTFNPTAKTVTLSGLDVPLNYVLVIINATKNQIIYNLAQPSLGAEGYQQGANSVITLKTDTTSMSATDQLTIFYDNGAESQIVLVQGPQGPQGIQGETGPMPVLSGYVESDSTVAFGASQITNIISISQTDYDAIVAPNPSTLYVII